MFYINVANKYLHKYTIVILRKPSLCCPHVFTPRYITHAHI